MSRVWWVPLWQVPVAVAAGAVAALFGYDGLHEQPTVRTAVPDDRPFAELRLRLDSQAANLTALRDELRGEKAARVAAEKRADLAAARLETLLAKAAESHPPAPKEAERLERAAAPKSPPAAEIDVNELIRGVIGEAMRQAPPPVIGRRPTVRQPLPGVQVTEIPP